MVLVCVVVCSFRGGFHRVHWWQVVRLSGLVRSFRAVLPAFCPPSCLVFVVLLANMPLFRVLKGFLGDFMGFVCVCVVLVLCVACGAFCARVELGGLKACSVFASILSAFHLLCPCLVLLLLCLLSFYALLFFFALVVFLCPLALSLWLFGCVVVSFSLSDYTQKERAHRVGASSLVLLWACLDVLKHYRYLLRFIVPMSIPFAGDSGNLFGSFRWVVYCLPVFIYR